jgi:membrane associated rhomboid family serine protease
LARRRRDLSELFTFGGRVPAGVGMLIALMLAGSVWGWLDRSLFDLAAFSPAMILRGQLWRLVTWPFFQSDPFTLLFGGFMLWSMGQQLSFVWSERRLVMRFFGYAAGASVLTTLLALVWPPASAPHVGVWPVANALIVAWAMVFPDRQVNIWGVLPLTGKTLALLVVFGTLLYGLAGGGVRGIGAFSLHLFAIGIAWLQARGLGVGRRGGVGQAAREWWDRREQRRRASHLKVVRKDGQDDRPRWLN